MASGRRGFGLRFRVVLPSESAKFGLDGFLRYDVAYPAKLFSAVDFCGTFAPGQKSHQAFSLALAGAVFFPTAARCVRFPFRCAFAIDGTLHYSECGLNPTDNFDLVERPRKNAKLDRALSAVAVGEVGYV